MLTSRLSEASFSEKRRLLSKTSTRSSLTTFTLLPSRFVPIALSFHLRSLILRALPSALPSSGRLRTSRPSSVTISSTTSRPITLPPAWSLLAQVPFVTRSSLPCRTSSLAASPPRTTPPNPTAASSTPVRHGSISIGYPHSFLRL